MEGVTEIESVEYLPPEGLFFAALGDIWISFWNGSDLIKFDFQPLVSTKAPISPDIFIKKNIVFLQPYSWALDEPTV